MSSSAPAVRPDRFSTPVQLYIPGRALGVPLFVRSPQRRTCVIVCEGLRSIEDLRFVLVGGSNVILRIVSRGDGVVSKRVSCFNFY